MLLIQTIGYIFFFFFPVVGIDLVPHRCTFVTTRARRYNCKCTINDTYQVLMKTESFNFWLYLHQNINKFIGSVQIRNNLDQHMQQYLVERTLVLKKRFKFHFNSHFCYILTFPKFQFSTRDNRLILQYC